MPKPVVAIVGRPNVGKSTLFNKIIGKRLSIVEDTPGVTRDRVYADGEWRGRVFTLIDTGGIDTGGGDAILEQMKRQAMLAVEAADVIVLVTDISAGMTADDREVALLLMRSEKPVVVCVNKCDSIGGVPPDFYEFYGLGLAEMVPVSSVHGHGVGDLLDVIFKYFPPDNGEEDDDETVRVAVVGKPNVGKSSLINRILGEERVIVSDVAGTTRDAVDTPFENEHGKFVFIDTAGLRKKSRVQESIERYSALRAYRAVDRADVVIVMLDAREGVTEQDTKIAGLAHERGKACIIAANKWDITEKDHRTMDTLRKSIMDGLSYMTYAPVVFISAKTGQRVDRLFELIKYVHEQNAMRISTGVLNDVLADATAKVQPPTDKGRRLKLYYITQASVKPPTFVVFVNRADLFHFSYQRYLENRIRAAFGLEGTPVRLIIRERGGNKGAKD